MNYQGGKRFVPYTFKNKGSVNVPDKPDTPKPTEICRYVYFVNNCGSKQIGLAYDVNIDFAPVFTIEKTGGYGVRISEEGLRMLWSSCDYITEYFSSDEVKDRREVLALTNSEVLEFKQRWGRNLATFKSLQDDKQQVTIARATWDGLRNLFPLLNLVLEKMLQSRSEVQKLFVSTAKLLKRCVPVEYSMMNSPFLNYDNVSQVVKNLNFSDLEIETSTNHMYDENELFLEMITLCEKELINYMYYV